MIEEVYVVQKVAWEYNDEHYYTGESDGGNPVIAYINEDTAKKVADDLTYKYVTESWGGFTPCEYSYDGYRELEFIARDDELVDMLRKAGVIDHKDDLGVSPWEFKITKEHNVTPELVHRLLDVCGIYFYSVIKVKIDG